MSTAPKNKRDPPRYTNHYQLNHAADAAEAASDRITPHLQDAGYDAKQIRRYARHIKIIAIVEAKIAARLPVPLGQTNRWAQLNEEEIEQEAAAKAEKQVGKLEQARDNLLHGHQPYKIK